MRLAPPDAGRIVKPGLYNCQVMHRRAGAVRHRFVHRALYLLLDVDRLAEQSSGLRLFSVNRFNLTGFRRDRYGSRRADASLRAWAEKVLRETGRHQHPDRILLLCMPDVLGAGFSPLSLWFCLNADQSPMAVIAEVHNTFGDSHSYVIDCDNEADRQAIRDQHDKAFYVSPFIGMDCQYAFRISVEEATLNVVIRQQEENQHRLTAALTGRFAPLTDWTLLKALVVSRFYPLKVSLLIHWQALRLWRKGLTLHPRFPPSTHEGS